MNADDPKLTAFALDELDPAEREDIATMLRDDPAAAATMEATRTFAAQVRTLLKAERAEGLHPAQRAELMARIESVSRRKVITISHRAAGLAALAASVIVGAGLALMLPALHSMKSPRQTTAEARSLRPRDGSDVRVSLAIERAQTSGDSLQSPDVTPINDSASLVRHSGLAFAPQPLPPLRSGFAAAEISLGNFQQYIPRELDGTLHTTVFPEPLNDFALAMPVPPNATPSKPARRAGHDEPVKQSIGSAPPPAPARAWSGGRADAKPNPAGKVSPQGSRP